MSAAMSFKASVLPWSLAPADEQRFRRLWIALVLLSLGVGLVAPWLPRPVEPRSTVTTLPPPLAKLLLEHEQPPAPPPKPLPPPDKQAPVQTGDQTVDKVKPVKPAQRPLPEARQPVPDKAPGEVLGEARRKAAGVGLLAMKDTLAEMHGAPVAVQLAPPKPGVGVGTGSGPGVGAGTDPGLPLRAMITSNATGGSGGINTAGYSRNTGGGGLAGRSTTLVEGVAGGGGGGGYGSKGSAAGVNAVAGAGANKGGSVTKGGSGKASRALEDIRLVFERNKGAIYAIYNRALREDPGLQGKVVLELSIAPAGQVTSVRVLSSELKAPELEQKLLARIRQFDFGAKDVDVMTLSYPLDFLPG